MDDSSKNPITDDLQVVGLAMARIVGGGPQAFYVADMRSFAHEGDSVSQVVVNAFGLRSMLLDGQKRQIKAKDKDGKETTFAPFVQPTLLRVYARPRVYFGSRSLTVGKAGAPLRQQEDASDLLVTPIQDWPDHPDQFAYASPFRLVEGRYGVEIQLTEDASNTPNELGTFLGLKDKSLFNGLEVDLVGSKPRYLQAVLTPEGIEFQGRIKDPTRPADQATLTIAAVFRLECDVTPTGESGYLLRLVRAVDAASQPAIDAVEAGIASAFAGLDPAGAPVAVRYDRRPLAPPLLWRLNESGGKLKLVAVAGSTSGDFEMVIDRNAIDVRVKTTGQLPDAEQGLAMIFAQNVTWRRESETAFNVNFAAGSKISKAELCAKFTRNGEEVTPWGSEVVDFKSGKGAKVALKPIADRLLPLYRAARAMDDRIDHAPYVFIPVAEGVVQLALPDLTPPPPIPSASAKPPPLSAMSGRVYVQQGGETMRGLVLDDAAGIELVVAWESAKPRSAKLKAETPKGQLVGFLFACESSPTALEALPNLQGGPAATRDLPLWFGWSPPEPYLQGDVTWDAKTGRFTADMAATVTPAPDSQDPKDPDPNVIAWLPPADSAFVTNHPLTRGLPAAAKPSVSRGLVPRTVSGGFTLTYADEKDYLPVFSSVNQTWWKLYADTTRPSFRDDTLISTTLAGAEFFPNAFDKFGTFKLQAALRFDLPILDELFAWSDPPKKAQAMPGSNVEPISVPTALEPARLNKIWDANRRRMALTRTQSAFVAKWLSEGTRYKAEKIVGLVETYSWSADVAVYAKARDAYGEFFLGGQAFRLDAAVQGLGGDKTIGPATFDVKGDELVAKGNEPIKIAGYAANLYEYDSMRWDSRGFGVAADAADGVRKARLRTWQSGAIKPRDLSLLTMSAAEPLSFSADAAPWKFAKALKFFARDLPLDGLIFDGKKNPVEAAIGAVGQAFDQDSFPQSLHEWRLFEDAEQTGVRRHDIRWGPFVFRPLRLLRATFDGTRIKSINVVGSMRLDRDFNDPGGPFGPDDIYEHGDLLQLALTRGTSDWRYAWTGIHMTRNSDGTVELADEDIKDKKKFAPNVTIETLLSDPGDDPQSYRFTKPVAATATIDIAQPAGSLNAAIELRLFGSDLKLIAKVTPTDEGFTATVEAPKSGTTTKTHVAFCPALVFKVDSSNSTLVISGPISVRSDKAGGEPLAEFQPASFAWLDLQSANADAIQIDHDNGAIHGQKELSLRGGSPLFSLRSRNKLAVVAALAFVCGDVTVKDGKLNPIEMRTAWMRVVASDDDGNRIDHRLIATASVRQHTLELTWSRTSRSPIRWPVGQMQTVDGKPLPEKWLSPADANQAAAERSRIIHILDDSDHRLDHHVTVKFNRHRILADTLACFLTKVLDVEVRVTTVREPVRLICIVDHRLQAGEMALAHWMTLDHTAITTPSLMAMEAMNYSFAPRSLDHAYRTETIKDGHAGIIQLIFGAAGFHDRLLADKLWIKSDLPMLLGGASTLFAVPRNGGWQGMPPSDFAAVVPWLMMDGVDPINIASGVWRVAAPDLWPATPMPSSGTVGTAVIGRGFSEPEIVDQFGQGRFVRLACDAAEIELTIPVEQAYFEKWLPDKGKAAPMDKADYKAAPFFLRAMMAIEARLKIDAQARTHSPAQDFEWIAETILAARLTKANDKAPAVAALRCRVGRRTMPEEIAFVLSTSDMSEQPMRTASITALSASRITTQSAYRRVLPTSEIAPGEAIEAAIDLDRKALVAIVEIDDGLSSPDVTPHPVPAGLDASAMPGKALTRAGTDLSPSAALGWPSDTATTDLSKLTPALGDEMPLLGHDSGFAARFQLFGWPAYAPAVTSKGEKSTSASADLPPPEALYLSFANHITYDRSTAKYLPDGTKADTILPITFDGPTARHLLPAVARRRAPTFPSLAAALDEPLSSSKSPSDRGKPKKEVEELRSAPTLPPAVERATIGRRPGVLEAAVASLTVPGDSLPFDPDDPRFGRPANSGPVAAHQLRNPRSPVLPIDELTPDELKKGHAGIEQLTISYRRRTYVSLTDLDLGTGRQPPFDVFDGAADVVRYETGKPQLPKRHDKVIFDLVGHKARNGKVKNQEAYLGPDWDGKLDVKLTAAVFNPDGGQEPHVRATGKLQIDALNLEISFTDDKKSSANFLEFDLSAVPILHLEVARLADARDALSAATADTKIRLLLELERLGQEKKRDLPLGPRAQVFLPLMLDPGMRRVVPVKTTTVVFADPSYDRQLASQTMSASRRPPELAGPFLVSSDRREYDLEQTLYLAGGVIDTALGTFAELQDIPEFKVELFRLPPQGESVTQPPPQQLVTATGSQASGSYTVAAASVVELPLKQMVLKPNDSGVISPSPPCALQPGDRLQIAITPASDKVLDQKLFESFALIVDIVADPVIAPPPAVYSVIETTADISLARVRLHAAGPLPQKIEFPDLLADLALEHVRRRALFVWRYAKAGKSDDGAGWKIELIKFDRSGGAQLPNG